MPFVKRGLGSVEGSVEEYGDQDADAVAGVADEGLSVGSAAVVVAAAVGAWRAANTERDIARFSWRFPPLGACSPWIQVPDRPVAARGWRDMEPGDVTV
ncbi:hypothetical protein ACM01_08065 [Streptomyces viridochromogenes]|uniref:Uncharacterized protein n=1 Tax=Streptomyces viridochromogenes TaxID=1938 RepID=A0A0J7ZIK3_STRVR|nr:hypothetical protein ACM01_08065 [Streptomyces viridochromogenes]KOG16915.1 hypothetical protein ADK36_25595 [Streptomyces viridochromogenes]KOG18211.1 hypothetical protein ADK35_22450 [Streptomyces viridochromogenes]